MTANAKREFEKLSFEEMVQLLPQLHAILEAKKREKAAALVEEARQLGFKVTAPQLDPPPPPDFRNKARVKPGPRYRSHRDPSLTWAGRGHVAGWLRQEMEETKLPMSAFEVKEDG